MKKVLLIYGLLVLGIIIVAVLQFRGVNLLPQIGGNNATVTISEQKFSVEVADTDEERIKGLSERKSLEKDRGMLFIFEQKGKYGFWMRNVNFPLDLIYISDSKIVDIIKNAEPKALDAKDIPVFEPEVDANFVLEINGGLSDEFKFEIGNDVIFENIN